MNAFFVYICESMKHIVINTPLVEINLNSCKKKNKAHRTHLILTILINKVNVSIMAGITLNVREFVTPVLNLFDSKTQQKVPATWTNIVLTSGNTTIWAGQDINGDGLEDIVALDEGVTNITVDATATYTDSNGKPKVEAKNVTAPVEVLLPLANATELVLDFTVAQPVP